MDEAAAVADLWASTWEPILEVRSDPVAFARRYWTDVEGWAREAIDWQGEAPDFAPYQAEVWDALYRESRVCVRAPRGAGKSALAALQVLHFCTTREASGKTWKVVTTAGSWGQLRRYLWPEINKWAARLRWDRIGISPWRPGRELQTMAITLGQSRGASAAAPTNPNLMEGAHEDEVEFLIDEAKSVQTSTWNAIEGTFANVGTRGRKGYWLAVSTPGPTSGRFWEIHRSARGIGRWWTRRITPEECIAARMMTQQYVDDLRNDWGENSMWFRTQVMAEFADRASERAVIPLDWCEAATERWLDWLERAAPQPDMPHLTRDERLRVWWESAERTLPALSQVGVDIGSGGPGRDPTAVARRYGHLVAPIEVLHCGEPELPGRILAGWRPPAPIAFDSLFGATVIQRVKASPLGPPVAAVNSSLPSNRRDRTGELQMLNLRSEMWWGLREQLDPSQSPTLCLPEDRTLQGELTEPEWEEGAGGKVRVEDKRQVANRVRKQVGREDFGGSTNRADALALACYAAADRLVRGGPVEAQIVPMHRGPMGRPAGRGFF